MSIADKLTTIAENEQKIYDKGRQDEYSDFWDAFQWNGTRGNYIYGFARWNQEYARPKYKVIPTSSADHLFVGSGKLKKIESKYFDLSQVPYVANGGASGYASAFNGCTELEEIEDLNFAPSTYNAAFAYSRKLHTIARVVVDEKVTFIDAFMRTDKLANISFDGVIGQDIDFRYSPLLTDASLNNITEHLKDFTSAGSGSAKITFHADIESKLGESGKAAITAKGWKVEFKTP